MAGNEEYFAQLDRVRQNIGRGVESNSALYRGDEGKPAIDDDVLQYAIYKNRVGENVGAQQETNPAVVPQEESKPIVDTEAAQNIIENSNDTESAPVTELNIDFDALRNEAHQTNAYRKYMGSNEDVLQEALKLKEESGVHENAFLGDDDSMALLRESINFSKKNDIDPEKIFKDNPALAGLIAQGKELEAAIAMNHTKDIQEQKSIIDLWQDAMKFDDLQLELSAMGDTERAGGKSIDENRVKEISAEMQKMKLPGMSESPFQTIVGGTFRQMPQMLRGALKAFERGAELGAAGAGVGAVAGGTAVPVAGAVPGAAALGASGFAWGARIGWFEGSYNEMVGANYTQLRMERNEDGTQKYTREEAETIATAQAFVSAGIESANVGNILGRIGGAKGILAKEVKDIVKNAGSLETAKLAVLSWLKTATKDAAKTTVEESLEEAAQSGSDDIIKTVLSNRYGKSGVSFSEGVSNAVENFVEAIPASLGFGIGQVGLGTIPAARRIAKLAMIKTDEQKQMHHTAIGHEMLQQVKEAMQNSSLFKKSPEVAAEVLHENLKDTGFDTVYINSEMLLEQENGEQLLRQAAEKAGVSEDEVNNIIANKTDLSIDTEVYFQTDLSNQENAKAVITYDQNSICIAKYNKDYKLSIQTFQDMMQAEVKEAEAAENNIVDTIFEEQDRMAAKQVIADHGWNPVSSIRKTIKELQGQITDTLNEWSPQWLEVERDEGVNYYIPGKGYGHYYNQYENEIIREDAIGSDIKGELSTYEWIPAKAVLPKWYENYVASGEVPLNAKERTSPRKREITREALFGNDRFGILDDAFGMYSLTPDSPEVVEARQQIEEKEARIAQLERLAAGFERIGKDDGLITRGLSKEAYKVYQIVKGALLKSNNEDIRKAAEYNAVILARRADRFAETMRAMGNENYTAENYLERFKINPNAGEAPQKGVNGAIAITTSTGESIITLFETANFSTFAHETGHMALQDLKELAEMENAPEQIKKDWATIKEWLEYKDEQTNFTKEQQEKFAKGFEAYLRTGEAPAAGLKKIFRQFKTWLCQLYKDFTELGGEPSPEIKAVMSRMLATQEEIDMAARLSAHNLFMKNKTMATVSDAIKGRMEKWLEEAKAEAEEKVMAMAMKDIQENYPEQRKQEEMAAREAIEEELDNNDTISLYNLLQDDPENKAMWLQSAGMTEEQYEKSLAELGGSREGAIKQALDKHMKEYDEGYATAENIRAAAEQAIANGDYSDKLFEFEMAYLEAKAEDVETDKSIADIESDIEQLFKPDAKDKKIDSLVKKINNLKAKVKQDKEALKKLKALQKEALAAQKAELEYKLEMQEWNDSVKLIDLRNEKNEQIAELKEQQEAEIAALKDKSVQNVEAVKTRYDKKLEALKEKYEKQAYKLWWKTTLDNQEKQEQAEYKAWWKGAADGLKKAEKVEAKKDKEIERLEHKRKEAVYNEIWKAAEADYFRKKDLAVQKQKYEEKLQALKEQKNAKIEETRNSYKEKLQAALTDYKQYRQETLAGLRAVRDAQRGFVKLWRERARNLMQHRSLSDYYKSEGRYKAEAKAANAKCNELMVKGQWQEAAQQKQFAIFYTIMAEEARRLTAQHDRIITSIKKKTKSLLKVKRKAPANAKYAANYIMYVCGFEKNLTEAPTGYQGFQTVINDLREMFMEPEFDERWIESNGLPSWMNAIEAAGNKDNQQFDYKSMSIEQLKEMRDFVNLLCKTPFDARVTDADGNRYKVEDAVADMVEEANERMAAANDGSVKVHQERTTMQNIARYARELRMNLLNMDNITRQLGEKAHSLIYDRINDAAMRKMVMQKEVTQKFKQLINDTLKNSDEFLKATYEFNGETLTGKDVLAIALNCGNKTNRLRLVEGFGVPEGMILKLLENLGDNEWKFVQGVWDMFGELYPQIKDVQYKTVGSAAKTVQADPFTIIGKDGKRREIKGGYYKIAYDKDQSVRAKEIEQMNAAKSGGNMQMMLSMGLGSTKNRAKSVKGMPIDTNLNIIANALNEQINIITMREAVTDVARIMNDSSFQDMIKQQYGMDMLNYMQKWLADQWLPASRDNDQMSRAMRWARTHSTIGILGFRLSTIVTNFANVLNVMMYIGPGNTMKALQGFYNLDMINHSKNIMEKSAFMRDRLSSKERDIRDALTNNIDVGNNSKVQEFKEKAIEAAFLPIAMTDFMFALPMWKAEYERVYREADTVLLNQEQIEAKAVREADASVRRMFGSGLNQDLAGFQKGNEALKLWTMFYTYFSVIYNAVDYKTFEGRMAHKQGMSWTKQAAPVVAGMMYMIIGQSIMDACIREAFGLLGDDDDPLERIINKSAKNTVDNAVGAIPGIRDAVPYLLDGLMGERQNDFRLPLWTIVVQMGKVSKAKDAYDLAYEVSKLSGLVTGLPQTALDSVPTTLKFLADGEKYDLWDYIKAVARDKKLK